MVENPKYPHPDTLPDPRYPVYIKDKDKQTYYFFASEEKFIILRTIDNLTSISWGKHFPYRVYNDLPARANYIVKELYSRHTPITEEEFMAEFELHAEKLKEFQDDIFTQIACQEELDKTKPF